jgi:hypothetical protein
MKKILFAILAGALLVSCDLSGSYSQTIPVYASFEYNNVKFESDSLFYKSDLGAGYGWQYLAFYHKVDTVSWAFHGGMMLSSKKGRLYSASDSLSMARTDSLVFAEDRFRVHSAKDANSNSYLVHYANPDSSLMPAHDMEFLATKFGTCQAYQCFVNNTGYVAYKVAQTFEPGDKLTLKATGYLDGRKTGEASITLAEYSTVKDSIMSRWTAFDLTKLQLFDVIDFEVISTKKEVPAYFCLDYFMASVTVGNE